MATLDHVPGGVLLCYYIRMFSIAGDPDIHPSVRIIKNILKKDTIAVAKTSDS